MVWTKERPKVPGWYWTRDPDGFSGGTIALVFKNPAKGGLGVKYHAAVYQEIPADGWEWAGPIPMPEDS